MTQAEDHGALVSGETSLLIVDDEANLRNQLAKAMERRGFTAEVAETVAEGKRAVSANPPAPRTRSAPKLIDISMRHTFYRSNVGAKSQS